jgi:hypothetical protein
MIKEKREGNAWPIFQLTPAQKKAFKALEKAWKNCRKEKIVFGQVLNHLYAFDGNLVKCYTDETFCEGFGIALNGDCPAECIDNIPDAWADDPHVLELTKKGQRVFEQIDDTGEGEL